MKKNLLLFSLLLISAFSSCKKCPKYSDKLELVPSFGFWLLHEDTGLPLVTDDTTITTYPPGSVKLVDNSGFGWGDRGRDHPPLGYGFESTLEGYSPPPNDTLFFYLHFLITRDIDTIKVRKIYYEHNCQRAVMAEYYYNNTRLPIDSSKNIHTHYRRDYLTIYKKP